MAALTAMFAIGAVLDLLGGGGANGAGGYSLGEFRAAFAVRYVLWAVGLAGVLRNRRVLRRRLAEDGIVIDPLPRAVVRRLTTRASSRAAA